MSVIEATLKSARQYADQFKLAGLPIPPGRKLAVVARDGCTTNNRGYSRVTNGDGAYNPQCRRYCHGGSPSFFDHFHLLGTEEFIIINHADCDMLISHLKKP